MLLYRVVVFSLLMSVIAGYTESQSRLRALDPAACPQYKCRTVHAYWGGAADYVTAVHVKDADGNADNGAEPIFTTNSTEDLPRTKDTTTVDHWKYPSCTPFCGKDNLKVWQATQEVLKSGTKVKDSKFNVVRSPCTATIKGAEGTTHAIPTNENLQKNAPPGYTPAPGQD